MTGGFFGEILTGTPLKNQFQLFFVNRIFAGINVLQMVSARFSKQRAILNNFDGECVAWIWSGTENV